MEFSNFPDITGFQVEVYGLELGDKIVREKLKVIRWVVSRVEIVRLLMKMLRRRVLRTFLVRRSVLCRGYY